MAILKVSYFCRYCLKEKKVFINSNTKEWICCKETTGCIIKATDIDSFIQVFENGLESCHIIHPQNFSIYEIGRVVMSPTEKEGLVIVLKKNSPKHFFGNGDRLFQGSYDACLR